MENPIFPNLPTFLAQLVSFLLVVYLLNRILYDPLSNMLAERAKKIKDAIDTAENIRLEAERLMSDHRASIDEAKKEAQVIRDQAHQVASKIREEEHQKAREEADRIILKAKAEMEKETKRAMDEIQGKVADLIIMAATKVTEKSLNKEDHISLINNYVSGLNEVRSGKEN